MVQLGKGTAYGYSEQIFGIESGKVKCSVKYNIKYESLDIMVPPHRLYTIRRTYNDIPEYDVPQVAFSIDVSAKGNSF